MKQPQMVAYSSMGFFLVPGESVYAHALCGTQHLSGAISPNSGLPLLLVASLDLADPRLEVSNSKIRILHLLYSWTCGICEGDFTYRESDQGVEILSYSKGPTESDFPYEHYPVSFPRVELQLQLLTSEEQAVIKQVNRREGGSMSRARQLLRVKIPHAQVGGEPRLMQWPLAPRLCEICGGSMPLLASIGNQNGSARGFTDNDFVQTIFLLCNTCTVVTAYNLTD
jgi:hypothetical protein